MRILSEIIHDEHQSVCAAVAAATEFFRGEIVAAASPRHIKTLHASASKSGENGIRISDSSFEENGKHTNEFHLSTQCLRAAM
jgi:hypothetical protein